MIARWNHHFLVTMAARSDRKRCKNRVRAAEKRLSLKSLRASWVLVTREMGVPGEHDGAGRSSLDHLFLDQGAIPTLVEVKRIADTRIRREVIGQMLDYAANAVAYLPVEEIKAKVESRCKDDGGDPEAEAAGLLGEGQGSSTFWQQVKTKLQTGRVLLIFKVSVKLTIRQARL